MTERSKSIEDIESAQAPLLKKGTSVDKNELHRGTVTTFGTTTETEGENISKNSDFNSNSVNM